MQHLLDAVGEIVLLVDGAGDVVFANAAVERLLGYRPEEVLGAGWWRLVYPNDVARREAWALTAAKARGEQPLNEYETEFKDRAGRSVWLMWQERFDSQGQLALIGRDITGLKQAWSEHVRTVEDANTQRRIADALRRLASIPEQNPNIVIELDLSGAVTYVNPAAAAQFPNITSLGQRHPFLHDFPAILSAYEEQCEECLSQEIDLGHKVYQRLVCFVWDSELIRIFASDISELKRTAEALRKSEERFHKIFEHSNDAIFVIDPESNCIVDANLKASAMLGYTRDELLELSMSAIHPHEMEGLMAFARQVLEEGSGWTDELSCITKNGVCLPIEMSASAIEIDDRICVIAAVRNIAERKKAQEALAESEERFRAIFELAPYGIVINDTDGRVLASNAALQKILGYSAAELSNMSYRDVTLPTDLDISDRTFQDVLAGYRDHAWLEKRYRRKDGTLGWGQTGVFAVHNEEGQAQYTIAIIEDITDRKRAEQELQRAKEAAEVANQAKSTFLANMSHELRTPLTVIIGYAEMLTEMIENQSLEPRPEYLLPRLQKIEKSGSHLLNIVNDVLDLSKIEAGRMDLDLQSFAVSTLVDDVVTTVQPLVHNNANVLTVRCGRNVGVMHSDPTRVRQILYNLLSNASKFATHGEITLEVERQAQDENEWMIFRVSDTGIGIAPQHIPHLFEPFTQEDASTTRKYGGTGLGLAITQRLCATMGGAIDVESEVGAGSTFTVRLPARIREKNPLPEQDGDAQRSNDVAFDENVAAEKMGMVLVIDDNREIAGLMADWLSQDGFQVRIAYSGEEGLHLAKTLHPDAITLDVLMPDMDGWTVLAKLKADAEVADIPVVMVSIVENKSVGFALGASDYLVKPIDPGYLTAVLHKYRPSSADSQWTGHALLLVGNDAELRQLLRRRLTRDGWTVMEVGAGREALEQMAIRQPDLILLDPILPGVDGFELIGELHRTPAWRSIPVVVITSQDLSNEDRRRLGGSVERVLQKGVLSLESIAQEVCELISARVE